eukprot:scaffold17552_cov32-Phaeocystis_antarctica.AAC.2
MLAWLGPSTPIQASYLFVSTSASVSQLPRVSPCASQRSLYAVLPALMAPHAVSFVDCFSTKLRLDEWDHACSQPGGVHWDVWMRHHCCELIAEKAILIATSANDGLENFTQEIAGHVIATTRVHAKLDEQCAKLHGVLPADLMVDVQGADKAQRQLVCPPQVEEFNLRLQAAG